MLLYLFGSKDGLVRALLARARAEELAMVDILRRNNADVDLAGAATKLWDWLCDPRHRDLLRLWMEGYSRSLVDPAGAWGGFAEATVAGWLASLSQYQAPATRRTVAATAQRSAVLAVLRGVLLDLLATGDLKRITAAVHQQLATLH